MNTFEIHITTDDIKGTTIKEFEEFCKTINAKPILIELAKGEFYRQPMISKIEKCNGKRELEDRIETLRSEFHSNNYSIKRVKIEVPFSDLEDVEGYYKNEFPGYFEWHGKINNAKEKMVRIIADKFDGRLSKNALKDQSSSKFITIRDYHGKNSILERVENLKQELSLQEISFIKEEFEYCIFDSNTGLDKGWID